MAPRPHIRVIIVGAGIGGLMLGILLQRMGVTYQIFERAPKVKPLGKAWSFIDFEAEYLCPVSFWLIDTSLWRCLRCKQAH